MQTPLASPSLTPSSRIYSVSQLKLYALCPLRYHFQYIERRKPSYQHIESFVGCRVHDTLEYLYHQLAGGKKPSISEVLGHYRREWETHWTRQVEVSQSLYGREWHRRFGEKCLRRYYVGFYPFEEPEVEMIGVEWKFLLTLQGEGREYRLQGQLDRLARHRDGTYLVYDYKTTKYVPPLHKLRMDIQPGVYQMAVHHAFPDAQSVQVHWYYLAAQRELQPTLSPPELATLQEVLLKQLHIMEDDTVYTPQISPACRWCDFKTECPAYQAQKARQAEQRRYLPDDWED